ncbi:MAG: DUF2889 domain-containing protein [Deltaproteobacteria bacterium]|nr:DUF2889 domain-containing protein [Deltaproteobacteria bacterium]
MSRTQRDVAAIYHRTKEVNIYPLGDDRFLIEAFLQDEIHDIHAEVEILHPSLEIVAARSEVRNAPFTNICGMSTTNIEGLIGMQVGRGFTVEARKKVGGAGGCHRISELVIEIAQASYQLHFVRAFADRSAEDRQREDNPAERHQMVMENIPGMRDTCFSYAVENTELVRERGDRLRLRDQVMPKRKLASLAKAETSAID